MLGLKLGVGVLELGFGVRVRVLSEGILQCFTQYLVRLETLIMGFMSGEGGLSWIHTEKCMCLQVTELYKGYTKTCPNPFFLK